MFAIASGAKLFLLASILACAIPAQQAEPFPQIIVQIDGRDFLPADIPYGNLLVVRSGEPFHRQKIRDSMANLYKTGLFSDIEVRLESPPSGQPRLLFICARRWRVGALHFSPVPGLSAQQLAAAAGAIKNGDPFRAELLPTVEEDLRRLLRLHGYYAPRLDIQTVRDSGNARINLSFRIAAGDRVRVRKVQLDVTPRVLHGGVAPFFTGISIYHSQGLDKRKAKVVKYLKKRGYLYPEIEITETWIAPGNREVDLRVSVASGFSYDFQFIGLPRKKALIRSVWERKVFENWALEESQARLLNHMRNEGYWNSQVQADVVTKETVKHVIFSVVRGARYKIGKVSFAGNRALTENQLREITQVEKQFFNRILWLRMESLLFDVEAIKKRYRQLGYTDAVIDLQTSLHDNRVDILFQIQEKGGQIVDSLHLSGNRSFSETLLLERMKTRPGGAFISAQLNEDIASLQEFFWSEGFAHVELIPSVGTGPKRKIEIAIHEGERLRMGDLIIIGASSDQRRLIERMFPMHSGDPFSPSRLQRFRAGLDNSSLFSRIEVETVPTNEGITHVLTRIQPDRSRFYGFGFGFVVPNKEDGFRHSGIRGTLEYQEKNLFNSTSTFAGMVQLKMSLADRKLNFPEQRGVITLDTPISLRQNIHSTVSAWAENEIFPSYQFNRVGIGASFFKYFSETLYLVWSLRLYRTELTDLKIPPYGVDQKGQPFDTTAFSLSLVREMRDDPVNPSRGHFLSADLKMGLPIFEKHYTFLKFLWNYQFHQPILKSGVFSLSLRNGFGFGDMSITERFFAGGSASFRGTRNDRLGPIYQENVNQPQGGNVLVLLNLEATFPFPFFPIEGLYYTVFADIGNVFEKSSQLDFRKLEKALGLGLKYKTPLGPIRLEVVWNPRKTAEQNVLFQFGLGNVY